MALRDNRRAKLIGTATFGKGTVQKVISFTTAEEIDPDTGKPRPRAAVRITLARLIAPSGNPITGVGVTPDQLDDRPQAAVPTGDGTGPRTGPAVHGHEHDDAGDAASNQKRRNAETRSAEQP